MSASSVSRIRGVAEITEEYLCGIYFLCQGDEIVYIGQAKNVGSRIADHRGERARKPHDRAFFLRVHPDNLNSVERFFIRRYRPRFNVKKNPDVTERRARSPVAQAG